MSKHPTLDRLLRVPIERGILVGKVGNGQFQLALRDRARKCQSFAEDEEFFDQYLGFFGNFEHYKCTNTTCSAYI